MKVDLGMDLSLAIVLLVAAVFYLAASIWNGLKQVADAIRSRT